MLTNYYTLRALVGEWQLRLPGSRLISAWSQARGECTFRFEVPTSGGGEGEETADAGGKGSLGTRRADETEDWSLKVSVQAPLHYLFMNPGSSRARKNVADVFEDCMGACIQSIVIADADRVVDLILDDGRFLRILLFGPKANIYLVGADNRIVERFRQQGSQPGDVAPEPRRASAPESVTEFVEAIRSSEGPLANRIRSVFPALDKDLIREICLRAGLDPKLESNEREEGLSALYRNVETVLNELNLPAARIYWEQERARRFSLIPLSEFTDLREELFDTVDAAVRVYVRRLLGQASFDRGYRPLERVLTARFEHAERSRDRMNEELGRESRADRYEHWGHLLMACQLQVPDGAESVDLDDIIAGSGRISIPLRTDMNAVRNAERYYDKARETRRARTSSVQRLKKLDVLIQRMTVLLGELSSLKSSADVDRFKKVHREFLAELSSQGTGAEPDIPFRHYELAGGYEVWVGRNAAQNDRLTLQFARKFDLWLHARGVGGSHTVLRLPGRNHRPPAAVIEQAAEIAAFHSKARTSSLAPVIVTERRYVRKPRKSLPGTVIVERERVIMVSPRLPGSGR